MYNKPIETVEVETTILWYLMHCDINRVKPGIRDMALWTGWSLPPEPVRFRILLNKE